MTVPVLVGLIDSGLGAAAEEDGAKGHGEALAGIILRHAPGARLADAQIFDGTGPATAAAAAAALHRLIPQGVSIVNMSFGLREDRRALRDACSRALGEGILLVAASPARGALVFPSAYEGVLRISGDARCASGEISHLATRQAEFGACPRGPDDNPAIGGASFATAHITGILAAFLVAGGTPASARGHLMAIAKFHGPERRGA